MLTQTLTRRAAVVMAAALMFSGSWQAAASAAGGPAGGFGGTQCGQSYTPSCTVTAGNPGGSGAGGNATGSSPQAGSGPPCTARGQTVTCLLGVGGGAGAPLAPAELAELAVRYLRLPDPVIWSSPAPGAQQLTGLPTWLWITPAVWRPQVQTAQVPAESVTATATPVSASWQMGDGQTVTCRGPGTPYTSSDNPASSSPACGYTYPVSSAGQPGGAFPVSVTITWDITWAGTGGTGGDLPPLFTTAAVAMRVAESQAVNTSGGA